MSRRRGTPLAVSAFKGNDRIAEQLLSRHADPNLPDEAGRTAMSHVRGFADIVRRLLDAGVGVSRRYRNNLTALMWASSYVDGVGIRAAESVIALLLRLARRSTLWMIAGRTALMMAAELDHAEVVDVLIKSGADRNLRDKADKSVFDLSANDAVRGVLVSAPNW